MKQIFNNNELNDKPVKFVKIDNGYETQYQILIIFEDNSFYFNDVVANTDADGYPYTNNKKPRLQKDIHLYGFNLNDNPIAQELIRFGIMSLEHFTTICQSEELEQKAQQEARDLNQLNNLLKKYPNYATRNKN
jgi:hypothetical protein